MSKVYRSFLSFFKPQLINCVSVEFKAKRKHLSHVIIFIPLNVKKKRIAYEVFCLRTRVILIDKTISEGLMVVTILKLH